MALQNSTWNPFQEIEDLHREIDRVFEGFGDGGNREWMFPFSRISFLPGRAARAYPLMNLSEDDENLYVEALAPGVDPEKLDVTLTGSQLSLAGEKKALPMEVQSFDFHRNERSVGRFMRTVDLPAQVDESRVKAEYKNGLILLTLPKSEAAKPREIAVTTR